MHNSIVKSPSLSNGRETLTPKDLTNSRRLEGKKNIRKVYALNNLFSLVGNVQKYPKNSEQINTKNMKNKSNF
jgi:hypothetical protein